MRWFDQLESGMRINDFNSEMPINREQSGQGEKCQGEKYRQKRFGKVDTSTIHCSHSQPVVAPQQCGGVVTHVRLDNTRCC